MKTYVLYHAACMDGLGAKFAAWKKFGDKAIYISVQYGKPLPEIEDGSHVYIVDFSYPRDVLEELRSRVDLLVVLDHHKTAQEALKGFSGAMFDMNKSGAVLAWEYFHPGTSVPMLLQHIQDRDLWRFEIPGTRELHAALQILGDDMQAWDAMSRDDDMGRHFLSEAVRTGHTILSYEQRKIESALKNVKVLPYKGFKAGVLNTTTLTSEIGNSICKSEELGVDFSLSYFFDIDGQPVLSFRSQDDFDVSVLARELGGGGHKNAAGARVNIDFLISLYAGQL